ncbi:MAG: zinc dependent phospholipase C family protein [Smithella sp.]
MAGTFTHWMVVEDALKKYANIPDRHPHFQTISNLIHFVYLGAVGPDYPYLTELLSGFFKVHSWADRMHYENTGEFVRYGIQNLPSNYANASDVCIAWLCGFASHLVVDSVIHPVVQATVGPYIFNSTEHRHCELTQDSYIFHEIKNLEIRHSDYARFLKMCSDPYDENKIHPYLRDYWIKTLQTTHSGAAEYFDKIDPDCWHENFMSRITFAEDPGPIFRHIAKGKNLAYKNSDELTSDERLRFIDQLTLPDKSKVDFRQYVFYKAVTKVTDVWKCLFEDIYNNNSSGPAAYLKDWNLDTGIDENNFYYW